MRTFSRLGIALGLGAALVVIPAAGAMAADTGPRPADVLIGADQIDVNLTSSGIHVLDLELGRHARHPGLQVDVNGTLTLVRGFVTSITGILTGDNGSGLGSEELNGLLRPLLGPKGPLGNGGGK